MRPRRITGVKIYIYELNQMKNYAQWLATLCESKEELVILLTDIRLRKGYCGGSRL